MRQVERTPETMMTMNTPSPNYNPQCPRIINSDPNHHADGLDERIAALLAAPIGQAFSAIAAATCLTPRELANPSTTLYIAAQAADDVELYHTEVDHQRETRFLREEAPEHADLVRQILAHPDAAWWFAPMDTDSQIWVSQDRNPPTERPTEPSWIHADLRQDFRAFITSTDIDGTASMLAAVDLQICDAGYGYDDGYAGPPFAIWRMQPAPDARVFEVDSPHAWHELCVAYPRTKAFSPVDFDMLNIVDLDAKAYLEPDWAKVANDWDAIHLTLGGMLTSHQVAVKSKHGWTYQHGWDTEQTWWLRWTFTDYTPLADHTPTTELRELSETNSIFRRMRGWD